MGETDTIVDKSNCRFKGGKMATFRKMVLDEVVFVVSDDIKIVKSWETQAVYYSRTEGKGAGKYVHTSRFDYLGCESSLGDCRIDTKGVKTNRIVGIKLICKGHGEDIDDGWKVLKRKKSPINTGCNSVPQA